MYEFVQQIIQNPAEWNVGKQIWDVKIVTGKTDIKTKQEYMRDKTKWRVDILIYSPFISSGVDYNEVMINR